MVLILACGITLQEASWMRGNLFLLLLEPLLLRAQAREVYYRGGRAVTGEKITCAHGVVLPGFSGQDDASAPPARTHRAHLEAQLRRTRAETEGRIFVERWSWPQQPPHRADLGTFGGNFARTRRARAPSPTQMKLMPAQPMLQADGGSMKPDMWIMVMNFLVHWTLAYAQVRGVWD